MENKDWLKELKVGDDVFLIRVQYCGTTKLLTQVDRITPTGQIVVNGCRFKNDGKEIGGCSRFEHTHLEPATKESILKHNQNIYCRKVLKRLNDLNKLTYEQAKKIASVMGWNIKEE